MTMIQLADPSSLILPTNAQGEVDESVKRFLTYSDRSVQYQLHQLSKNMRWAKSDPDSWLSRKEELKAQQKKVMIFNHPDTGVPCTYSGLWQDLHNAFGWQFNRDFKDLSSPKMIPWAEKPPTPRYYQDEAVDALLAAQHGSIELPTASGKTLVIENLCYRYPTRTLIVTPSKNITNQIYATFVKHFGAKRVGKYGAGKHDLGKMFTVCTGQSLINVEKDTEEWEFFSKAEMLIWDESHTTPAETFDKVCLGVARQIPLRFFISATQTRGDGSLLKLRGLIGPIVYRKEFRELVDEGFLARPFFKVMRVPTNGFTGYPDVNKETEQQLYLNPHVNKIAAEFAHKAVNLAGRQTMILIDNFRQFMMLRNYITIPFEFAHGGASDREYKEKKADGKNLRLHELLPQEYWASDVDAMIQRFNEGKTKLLVGTSAIGTGVDTVPAACLVYLQGGMSETQVKQAIGRGTRITETKKDLLVVDFKVMGSNAMERHAMEREAMYNTMGQVNEYDVGV